MFVRRYNIIAMTWLELLPTKYSNGYELKQALEYIHEPPVDANMQQLNQGSHPPNND